MKGKVGIVTRGSIFIKTHSYEILKPRTLSKCVEGTIIGCSKIDNGITNNSQTWLIANEPTEVLFFD